MVRLQIALDPIEAKVLATWAAAEMRDPREQIRFVLRQELEKHGLLAATEPPAPALPAQEPGQGGMNVTS
jgi:hypothetical protein